MDVATVNHVQEVVTMQECSCGGSYVEIRKPLQWKKKNNSYAISNIPYLKCPNNCSEVIMNGEIALHLAIVMDEMEKDTISRTIDFNDIEKLF